MVLVVKNLPVNARDGGGTGSIPGSGRSPGGGHGNLSSILAWKVPWMERSLVGYSPQGCKESDMMKLQLPCKKEENSDT